MRGDRRATRRAVTLDRERGADARVTEAVPTLQDDGRPELVDADRTAKQERVSGDCGARPKHVADVLDPNNFLSNIP